jgi:hypothetical protein
MQLFERHRLFEEESNIRYSSLFASDQFTAAESCVVVAFILHILDVSDRLLLHEQDMKSLYSQLSFERHSTSF